MLILYCTAVSPQTARTTPWTTIVSHPQLSSCPTQIESLSVTFLVDTTGSMSDDLQQLKLVSNWLMNQVEKRLPCGARQYIMVEFNDPDVGPVRTTTSKDEFSYYFNSLTAWGGGDCPELAILGLKLALERSPFGSIILVLTDASAKDYNNKTLLNEVYTLLEVKKPQIFFLITGLCSSIYDPDFLIYRNITQTSFGNLFQIGVSDIGKVATYLDFALSRPANSTSNLLSRNYDSYGYHSDSFHVDQHYSSLLLTTSGTVYDIGIIGPNATNITVKAIMAESWGKMFTVTHPPPGNWSFSINAWGPHSITVSGFKAVNTSSNMTSAAMCSSCHINATCETYGDIRECVCKDGFIGDGFNCSDIDECAHSWTYSCGSGVCVNTFGSYICRCAVGYIEDPPGGGCRDINECAYPELNRCHPSATCYNYMGGYYCTCPYGSYGDGFHCDVNECLLGTPCSSDTECINTLELYYCSDPCDNHTVLNENWRSTNASYYSSWYANCDSAKRGWFRFVGAGGVQMPEYCVPEYSCSTHAPMWLNGRHPSVSEGIVARTACAHWAGSCCLWQSTINVKACHGGYYVYKLDGTPTCSLVYCTDPNIVMNDCSSLACAEDEECKEVNGTLGCYCKKEYESSMYYDFRKLQPALTCSTSQMKVSLNKCQLDAMGYDISSISLKDRMCMGAVEVYNKSSISLTTYARSGYCGTQLTQNKTHVTYSNTIYLQPKSVGIIIRDKETYINYHCTYPLDMRVSLDLALNPFISSSNISIGGTATYSAKMALYQNADFTRPFEGNRIILSVEAMLYFGIMVEDADGYQFAVVIRNCYATPTRNPFDSVKYYIIKDRCPNKQDSTISVVENGLSLQARFSLQMFKFVGNYPEVYAHCEISLCDITVGSCVPVCSGMRSSNPENDNNNVTISIGPIEKNERSDEGSKPNAQPVISGCRDINLSTTLISVMALLLIHVSHKWVLA